MIDCTKPAWEQSQSIINGEYSSEELVTAYIERIHKYDSNLNSYITVLEENALKQAKNADVEIKKGNIISKLHGIPVALKDNIDVKNILTTSGSTIFRNNVAKTDSSIAAKLKQSGAIILGKHNLHELAGGATSDNPIYGTVHNPWNTNHIPGGSSGGTAAAVAASLCAAGVGTDGGGSVRGPAARCGVVGLLPTTGRIGRYGILLGSMSTLSRPGPLTRDVRDMAVMLEAIAGSDPRDPASSDNPVPCYESFLDMDMDGVRVGVPTNFFNEDSSPEVESAVARAVQVLESLGAETVEVELWKVEVSRAIQMTIGLCEGAVHHVSYLKDHPDDYSWDIRARRMAGTLIPAVDYLQAQQIKMKMVREYLRLFDQIDVVVNPTKPETAPRIGTHAPSGRTTALYNVLGFPALSVPCGFDGKGLPIGLQIAASPFNEGTVLGVAEAYEKEAKWTTRRPPSFP